VERLLQEQVHVKCLLRDKSSINVFEAHERLSFVEGDITQPKSLVKAFADAWAVINIAGLREFWDRNKKTFYKVNHIGAENVFKACLEKDIQRVIQVSTPLAFGVPKTLPFNETTPAGNHPSSYGHSKYLGDESGIALQKSKGLPLTIVYLAAVIGAGDDKETMEVRRAVEGRMPALIGADTQYTYLYVRDAAEAIVRSLMEPNALGERLLIGAERATTREYFSIIGDIAKVKIPDLNLPEKLLLPVAKSMEMVSKFSGKRPELPLDVLKTTMAGSLLFDVSKAEKMLNMEYTPLSEALAEAIADVRAKQ
jgi:dihydroflavonol-4-reductase